jgi:glycosyltransferase involved in cell wall biosynthesis
VKVVGYVNSVASVYRSASVVIAPIVDGGGTKIKVLESLQHRCATVATSQALRGYEHLIKDGEALFVADDPVRFAERLIQLLRDESLRQRLGNTGAAIVESHFSRKALAEEVDRILRGFELLSHQHRRTPHPAHRR